MKSLRNVHHPKHALTSLTLQQETVKTQPHTHTHSPAHLVTAGVDQLLKHLTVDLPGTCRVSRPGGWARLIGKGHERLADFPQGVLVVVELLWRSELLLSTGCVFPALAVGPSAAL